MTKPSPLQFGAPEPGVVYKDRPAAFGIAPRGDRIALVRVSKAGAEPWLDLPGGALDPGEDEHQALVREFGEETGLTVKAGAEITRADQHFRKTDGEPVNNRSGVYAAEITGEDAALKIEEDHELVWLEPDEAARRVRHDSHAWAILAWLRARLDRSGSDD
jgi:8-oxo-dGTP diphosphatase